MPTASRKTRLALTSALVMAVGPAVAAADCATEAEEIMAALVAIAEEEPGAASLTGQVELAIGYCDEGQMQLYDAFISPARSFLSELAAAATEAAGPGADAEQAGE